VEVLAQEGAAVVERAPVPRRRVRALDVGDDDGGATYSQVVKLTAADGAALDEFGYSVAIDCDTGRVSCSL